MVLLSRSGGPFVGISMADFIFEPEDIQFGTFYWFVYAGISCLLVLFAGIMSGLTLGLMSLGLVELEILQRSGSSIEKKQAAAILPVLQKQHQLLVTLLLCNACAMEALPIYLDKIFHPFVAVVLSVTFVLAFGEVLDAILGHDTGHYSAELSCKALSLYIVWSKGKGEGAYSYETMIISGALTTENCVPETETPVSAVLFGGFHGGTNNVDNAMYKMKD
ncbi:hypothetical protein Cgig2_020570 [Carnegiea gigantea]|uniref:CNNM transmembrane domain-containing protein n=1 Tax=Carnegiea gigantea TaxID=171969 RepID=A0A9Q1JKH0_9CARY|nr:hypothetical protein Cgig2_020570 [Carnegiea gigantea]